MTKFLFINKVFKDWKIFLFLSSMTCSSFRAVRWLGACSGFDSNIATMIIVKIVQKPAVDISKISNSVFISRMFSLWFTIRGVSRKLTAIPNWEAKILNPDIRRDSFCLNHDSANFDGKFERKIWKTAQVAWKLVGLVGILGLLVNFLPVQSKRS